MPAFRVCLANPPWKKPGFFGVRAGSRWPHFEKEGMEYMPFPFFLAYAAALLEQQDRDVLLCDAIAENMELPEFLRKAASFAPDLIVLEVSTSSIDADLQTIAQLKATCSNARIVLCGLHALMTEASFMKAHPEIDGVMPGEYELTLAELCSALADNREPDHIEGLHWRRTDGEVVRNPRRPLLDDLDTLPWPARHHLPMMAYRDEPGNLERPSVQIWTTRGCPFRCTFCAWPQIMYGDHSYRMRSIVDVVDEIEWLHREYKFKSFYIDDDTFNVRRERTLEFCKELGSRGMLLPWGAMCRADLMDEETLQAMRRAGLYSVKYGVESADQTILNAMNKSMRIDKTIEVIRFTKQLGIKIHLTFVFGMPGETRESAQRTLDLALDLFPESLQFTMATPFPGSRLYKELDAEGKLVVRDFGRYDGFHSAVIRTDGMSREELQTFVAHANKTWQRARYGT